jgi:hypothetical protein
MMHKTWVKHKYQPTRHFHWNLFSLTSTKRKVNVNVQKASLTYVVHTCVNCFCLRVCLGWIIDGWLIDEPFSDFTLLLFLLTFSWQKNNYFFLFSAETGWTRSFSAKVHYFDSWFIHTIFRPFSSTPINQLMFLILMEEQSWPRAWVRIPTRC